jgi:predicted kinase
MSLAYVAREQVRVAADDCGAVRIEQQGATASGVIESGGGVHALRRGEATTLRAGDALALLASEPEATRVLRVLGDSASDPTNTTPAALPEAIGSKRRAGSEAAGGGVRAAKARKASEVVIELTDSSNDEGGKMEAASADSAQGGAMLLLVGLPGAGKSTVAKELVGRGTCAGLDVTRVCQDVLKKREACIRAAHNVVRAGGLAVVDRTHYDGEQRGHFVKLAARMGCPVAALTLTAPAAVCGARASSRSSHEGGLTGGKAYGVVNRLAGRWGAVNAATEGFHAARKVHELATVQDAVEAAAAVVAEARERHSRRLSSGCTAVI